MLKKNEIKLEIKGEGHTLGLIVQKELLEDSNVELAGYDVPHPLIDTVVIYIKTVKGKKPKIVLVKSLDKLKKKLEQFGTKFEKAWSQMNKKV